MESAPQPGHEPEPRKRPPSHIFLDPKVIEAHLQTGQPIDGSKAAMIYRMNQRIDEFDPNYGPGIARPGEW